MSILWIALFSVGQILTVTGGILLAYEIIKKREEKSVSALEETLLWQIKAMRLPMPEREYRFAPPRKWRSDFCFVDKKILVECEGGEFVRGRHQRPRGYAADCEKYNAAQLLGFKVLRFTGSQIKKGIAIQTLQQALKHANN